MEEPGVRMTEVPELGKAPEAPATIRDHHLDPRDLSLRARGHQELIKPLEALQDQTPLELTHRVVDLPALEGMLTFGTNQINQIMDQVSVSQISLKSVHSSSDSLKKFPLVGLSRYLLIQKRYFSTIYPSHFRSS